MSILSVRRTPGRLYRVWKGHNFSKRCSELQIGKMITFELQNFNLHFARSQRTSQVDGRCLQQVGEDGEAPCETRYDCDFPLFFLLRPPVTWLSRREILIWPCVCSVCLYSSPIALRHSCPFSAFTYLPSYHPDSPCKALLLCQAAGITQMVLAQARMLF